MSLNTELLIDLVQKYPSLFDRSHTEYKNKKLKNKTWDTIATIHGGSDGETLKKQWKNLRDSYSKHLRSCNTSTPSTGPAAKFNDRYKTWPWAKQMAFLRPHVEFAETHSNIQRKPQQNTPQHIIRRKRRTSDQAQVNRVINYLSPSTEKDDDIDLLFKSYSKKLKKMSERRQATVKFEIAKIMMEAEIEESDEMQSRSDTGQYLDDSMVMLLQPHASGADSDTKESSYIVSSSPPNFDPLSPPSPSYGEPPYTPSRILKSMKQESNLR